MNVPGTDSFTKKLHYNTLECWRNITNYATLSPALAHSLAPLAPLAPARPVRRTSERRTPRADLPLG